MTTRKKVLVVFGSGTRLLGPLIEEYQKHDSVIRIYRTSSPAPQSSCIDLDDTSDLDSALTSLERESGLLNIDFVGAASEYQNSLFSRLDRRTSGLILNTGVLEYVHVAHVLLRFMVKSRYGRLVFLSSFRTLHRGVGMSLYAASKSFNETFFTSLGTEYGRLGITSCAIRMGYFDGRMLDNLRDGAREVPPSLKTASIGTADDLCSTIKFAFSNKMVNGGVVELFGGLSFE